MSDLIKNLNSISNSIDKAIERAVEEAANEVRNNAIRSIVRDRSSGRVYKRGDVTHIASKPGDSPNTDTGNLASKISVEYKKGSGVAHIGTSVEYGLHLEFGTRNMEQRPWLRPALQKVNDNLPRIVGNAIFDIIEENKE